MKALEIFGQQYPKMYTGIYCKILSLIPCDIYPAAWNNVYYLNTQLFSCTNIYINKWDISNFAYYQKPMIVFRFPLTFHTFVDEAIIG
jgi:hypothetical protein